MKPREFWIRRNKVGGDGNMVAFHSKPSDTMSTEVIHVREVAGDAKKEYERGFKDGHACCAEQLARAEAELAEAERRGFMRAVELLRSEEAKMDDFADSWQRKSRRGWADWLEERKP